MKKQINIIVTDTCDGCPFCHYDPHYGRSYDSGYDCNNPDSKQSRIAGDNTIDLYNKKLKQIEKDNKSLFKSELEVPVNPMTIPDWCPLETIK